MATPSLTNTSDWTKLTPQVNSEAEFLEIASDFGNPLEIIREAISNAIDAKAAQMSISFSVEEIDGAPMLVIRIADDGIGMTHQILSQDFWGLGFSTSRNFKDKIGEKGHGTKIYLRSETVTVRTQHAEGAFESHCERPMRALTRGVAHEPYIRTIDNFRSGTGTEIEIVGYNQNERSSFVRDIVKDYIYWFTKFGSVEGMFATSALENFKLRLKCLDHEDFEELRFGHIFPPEQSDIEKLFEQYGANAADFFVKHYVKTDRLKELPEVTYQLIISVEGDQVKRDYNPMIRERRSRQSGRYKVLDRYGLYLCKDFIPIQKINDWISGFGTGSNSFTLLHGFINCQRLKLTANRGSIANTDPKIIEELKKAVQEQLDLINTDLSKRGIFTLFQWQSEERTLAQEKADFESRTKSLPSRRVAIWKDRTFLEPRNEAELFGLFMQIYAAEPQLFDFEPLDYNTNRGIDVVARNRSKNKISESTFWYVEFKYLLRRELNHGFKYLRWIVCWDFEKSIKADSEFSAIQEPDARQLELSKNNGKTLYFLNSKSAAVKIQVIRLKQYLEEHLGIIFQPE